MSGIRLGFYGAARTVTGSCTLLETDGARVLVDCGLSQERQRQSANWDPFPVSPDRIDAVVLHKRLRAKTMVLHVNATPSASR